MKISSVSYEVKPSFHEAHELRVEIAWVDRRRQFRLDIRRGLQPNRRRWFAEDEELAAILREIAGLRLPLAASGSWGVDGTGFKLEIGHMPSATLTWWLRIPEEWAALKPIVAQIERVVEREA
jgi:hypothetical protein